MRQIHSYVIRIYRRDAQAVAGVVEDVASGRSSPFQSIAELGALLSGPRPRGRFGAKGQPGTARKARPSVASRATGGTAQGESVQ